MSLANYTDLQTFLASFVHRSSHALTVADIPDFIQLGEGMIARDVRAIEMITSVTLAEIDRSSGAIYNLPTDFLGMRSLFGTYQGDAYQVKHKSMSELRSYATSAPPFFYTNYGLLLEFRGTPATDSEFDLIYFGRPVALATTATNSLLTNHPALYVHSSLHWLHLKTQDLELAKEHERLFIDQVSQVNALAARQRGNPQTAGAFNFGLINARSSM